MFRVFARRLVAALAVVLGVFALAGAANAQNIDRTLYGYQAPERAVQAPPRMKKHVHAASKRKAYAFAKARRLKAERIAAKRRMMAMHAPVPQAAIAARPGSTVEARVDLGSQRMVVTVGGEVAHVWHVSTARKGFVTPRGVYSPKRMHVSYFSKKYYNSPMPYSIFFKGGYAVHGTGAIKALGRPASHGCIRLATGNARTLYNLVKQFGAGKARIVIT